MSHDPIAGAVTGEVFSRRRFLAGLGVLTLAATVGSSLLLPDQAEAGKKKRKSKKKVSKKKSTKRNHGKRVSKVAKKGRKHGKKVSRVARKKGRKKRY